MTLEEKAKIIERLRLELEQSYKAKALWSYTVGVWIPKIPSYRRKEPVKEEISIVRSNWPFYLTVLFSGMFMAYLVINDIALGKLHYELFFFFIIFISVVIGVVLYYQNKSVKELTINKEGITCNDVRIPWANIFQIYIASYSPASYSSQNFLCIALNDYSFKEFEVSNWSYRNIGNVLQHYKETYIDIEQT